MNSSNKSKLLSPRFARVLATVVAGGTAACLTSALAGPAPDHGIVGASINVTVNDFFNNPSSVTFVLESKTGPFLMIQDGSNNGDYDTQIGDNPTNNVYDGMMISCVRQNGGRDNGWPSHPGTNFAVSMVAFHGPNAGRPGAFWIPVAMATNPTDVVEYDINVAAAWFPYSRYIGGLAYNGANGGALTNFISSPGLVLGTHFQDLGGGKSIVDLTSLGIDSRTDGTLLVVGAKNENNYAVASVNPTNGTWNLMLHDVANNGTSTEPDPIGFVFLPKTETNVISGRFSGDGNILTYSGDSPQFTVSSNDVGTFELKLIGKSPHSGVLIISPEGGFPENNDNMVSYETNAAGDGWIIESRDMPVVPANTFPQAAPLETPDNGTSPICGFVWIPGQTPGVTVSPTNGLVTSELGQQATFTVGLDARPTSDVTISVTSSDTTEGTVIPDSLTFTPDNWWAPQTVTVVGVDDFDKDGTIAYQVILGNAVSADPLFNGLASPSVSLVNIDNESGGFVFNPTGGLTTTEAGGAASFNVSLSTAPTDTVTINFSSSDTSEGTVSPSSLTFDPFSWFVDQTVTVTGVNDFVVDGDISYSIITSAATSSDPNYSGLNPPDVGVVNTDDDAAGLDFQPGPNGFQVVEGQSSTFTVALTCVPTNNVTVSLASGDTTQGGTVSPLSLSFTPGNWNVPQTVTVNGADDLVLDGNFIWRITNSVTSADLLYAAVPPTDVIMTTLDNEPVLTLPSGDLIYGIGQPGVGIDGRATIEDTNTVSYPSATLTVTLTANGTADDRLEIRNTGTAAGQIGVSGSTISYGGTPIATFTGGTGTTPLVVTFNASANPTAAEALLRSITFRNVSSSPSLNRRSLSVALARADGASTSALTGVKIGLLRVADFQESADHGYGVFTGQFDIELVENNSSTAFPAGHSATGIWVDARRVGYVEEDQALIRFDNIVGAAPGQVPPGATVVYAELLLTVPDLSNARGDGSPLFRMKVPWNAETETWDSLGTGIQIDDVEARSTFDSQIGTTSVSGDTGQGAPIPIGVTADVQAWVNGEVNYGWGLTSWDQDLNAAWGRGSDGMAFSPTEVPNIDARPRLRVYWVPAGTTIATFRQSVDSYIGAHDTFLYSGTPDVENSTLPGGYVDWDAAGGGQFLLRFDDIIGTAPGQVPPHAHIYTAFLDLATVYGTAYGDGGQFFAMLQPWQDTDTWNTLANGISNDGIEAAVTANTVAGWPTLSPNVCGGYMAFDVTPDLQAWANGSIANNGWAIIPWPNGGDGWGIATSDAIDERDRPRLRVLFATSLTMLPPIAGPGSVQVRFLGAANTAYVIERAPAVTGTWGTLTTVTTGADGSGTYTDNAPLTGAAFYRARTP